VRRFRAARPAARATRRVRATGLAILAALAVAIAFAESWNGRLQAAGLDVYQALMPRDVVSTPAIIVQIEERSLAALGQWPWPRTTLARLVRAIARHEPLAIGIDVLMPEPDRLSPEHLLRHAEYQAPALARELAALPSHDEELARALAATPSVLGTAGSHEPTGMTLRAPPFVVQGTGADATTGITRYAAVTTSIDVLDRAAAGHGLLSVDPAYGVVRRIPLVFDVGGTLAPALAIEMLRIAVGAPSLRLLADGTSVRGIAVGDFVAPTEKDGAVRPHFSPRDPRRFVAAVDVLDGRVDPESLRRKLVLVATTGLGLVDDRNTPLGISMPGAEIHAQLLENLYDGTLLARPRWASAVEVALFVAAGSLLILVTPVWPPKRALPVAVASILLPIGAGFVAFRTQRWLLDAVTPSLGLALLFAALLALTLAEAERRRRALELQMQRQREREARMAGELEAARRIQTGMLPRADLLRDERRVDLAALMIPAREVGGDLYDYFMLDGRRLFLLVGDVAGKGLSASIFMAISKALYKSATLRMADADIGELMSAANDEVSRDNPEALFVTAFAAILDLDGGNLAYCNAGHDNPYLLRPGAEVLARLSDGDGPPLCAVDGFRYTAARHQMQRGELLCIVTDGVTESRDRTGALYGSARLQALLAGSAERATAPQALVDALHASVESFAGKAEVADDLTVLALRWNGSPTAASR
jgi:serine phosphatase RsbU (regulator of sigma subunit)/CHASE2 domain-containing sensor protein